MNTNTNEIQFYNEMQARKKNDNKSAAPQQSCSLILLFHFHNFGSNSLPRPILADEHREAKK